MNEPTPKTSPTATRFPRWLKWSLFGALAVLVVGYGAIFLYAKVINDSPDAFSESDLVAVLDGDAATASPPTPASSGSAPEPTATAGPTEPSATTSPTSPTSEAPATGAGGEQVWTITDESQVGYRVAEVLFGVDTEAVGRTNRVTGSITIEAEGIP